MAESTVAFNRYVHMLPALVETVATPKRAGVLCLEIVGTVADTDDECVPSHQLERDQMERADEASRNAWLSPAASVDGATSIDVASPPKER